MTARRVKQWLASVGTEPVFIEPESPWENGYCESFNGKLRDECLNVEWFPSLEDAQRKLAAWRENYNHNRQHSALDDRAPAVFAQLHGIVQTRFARSESNTATAGPRQGFAAPARGRPGPGQPLPEDIHYVGEAPFRIAQTRVII